MTTNQGRPGGGGGGGGGLELEHQGREHVRDLPFQLISID